MHRRHLRPFGMALTALGATPARAQVRDLGEVADGLSTQIGQFGDLLGIAASVMGVGLAVAGLLKLRAHSNSPNDPSNKVSSGILLVFLGAAMVALPELIGSGISTLFGNTSGAVSGEDVPTFLDF